MNLLFLVYLIDIIPDIKETMVFISAMILLVSTAASIPIYFEAADNVRDWYMPLYCKWAPRFVVIFVLGLLLPSKVFLYTAAGLVAGNYVVSSDTGQKALELVNKKLEEALAQYETLEGTN